MSCKPKSGIGYCLLASHSFVVHVFDSNIICRAFSDNELNALRMIKGLGYSYNCFIGNLNHYYKGIACNFHH